MTRKQVKKLFKVFESVSMDGMPLQQEGVIRGAGIGLGLRVCKDLVRELGGDIGIESILGKGTVVTFDIRVNCSSCNSRDPRNRLASAILDKKRSTSVVSPYSKNHFERGSFSLEVAKNTASQKIENKDP